MTRKMRFESTLSSAPGHMDDPVLYVNKQK